MKRELVILVVDDEPKIVEVLSAYLGAAGYTIVTAKSGRQALELYHKHQPDLVVLDLMLPEISGEEICKAIRRISPIPILMLTAKADEQDLLAGLDLGADDYVAKPFSPKEVVGRVRALLRRANLDTPIANRLSFDNDRCVIDIPQQMLIIDDIPVKLTPSEFRILAALVRHPTKVFPRDELITIAFGDQHDTFDRTVDSHIKNLRQKIEVDKRNPRYVLTVHGVGYRFGGASNE